MFNLGPMELAVILILALLVFGPKKLPEIGKGVGQAMREFKRASRDLMESFQDAMDDRPKPAAVSDSYASPSTTIDSTYPYQPAGETAAGDEPIPAEVETHAATEPEPATAEHQEHHSDDFAGRPTAAAPSSEEPTPATVAAAAEPGQTTAHAPERTS